MYYFVNLLLRAQSCRSPENISHGIVNVMQTSFSSQTKVPDFVLDKLIHILPGLLRDRRKVCLSPAGSLTRALLSSGLLAGLDIVAVIDRAPEKNSNGIMGLPVIHPSNIVQSGAEAILVFSLSFRQEIILQLIPGCVVANIDLIDMADAQTSVGQTSPHLGEFLSSARRLEQIHTLLCQAEIRALLSEPRFSDPRRIENHGYKCYSQHDEDGILAEIINRLERPIPHCFVEFGVGDGMENNTFFLLKQGWEGLWIEGSPISCTSIRNSFSTYLDSGKLKLLNSFINKENIDGLISSVYTGDIGVLSVDIDGNDYYVWERINSISPLVAIVEYNGKFPPPLRWTIDYDENHSWKMDDYQGASLAALFDLAQKKNYQLVGCNLNGTNAFFVRKDCLTSRFLISNDPADYYHPARYYLTEGYKSMAGHAPSPRPGRFWS